MYKPAEADENGEEREQHDRGVGDVGEEDCQLANVKLAVIDENKEEDETDEGRDEDQQTEEESLAGPHTVHSGVGHHLPRGDGEPVQLVVPPEPDKHPINYQSNIAFLFN